MRFKIRGGTANHGEPPLCATCRCATIAKGPRLRDEIVECSRLSERATITFPVVSCTGYSDKRLPSIHEMEETAWVLRSDPRRNHLGFVHASRLTAKDRYTIPDEWD